jgi:NAD+ kinase
MKFGIIGNLDKPELGVAVSLLVDKLNRSGVEYIVDKDIVNLLGNAGEGLRQKHSAPREECVRGVDMVVALGGDGTILSAARLVGSDGTPILGVNLGKLGFLAEIAPEEMSRAIGEIVEKKFVIEERLVLEATCPSLPGRILHGVNDIVVGKSRSSRVVDMDMHINGAFAVTYRGDGLVMSTPTGSTAYALSNGGPIVTPVSRVIGITPIAPHTLSGRPLIVPDTDSIRVVVQSTGDEILISADGQEEAELPGPLEVFVRKAQHQVRLVKRVDRTYYDVLRAKLLWGKDARSAM